MKIFFLILFLAKLVSANCTTKLIVDDPIGPATFDYIQRGIGDLEKNQCESILLLINTPGGDLQSTRKIVQLIMNSEKAFLCLVHPSGGHAGSAGAIILQACHVAGAVKATNLGAATPVQATGKEMPKDLRKKIMNDTLSWMEGITKRRGRNLEFSKEIITEAKAVSAEEAEKLGAIDKSVNTVLEFLEFAKDREVEINEGKQSKVIVGDLKEYKRDLRYKVLNIVADPQFSYLLFMGSLGLLYFELTHPGAIVPGVVGALGLTLSMISFYKLDVQWGGLALMLLGLIFLIAEAFIPSFGALGIGGIVAFTLGGIFLFDGSSGYSVPLSTILPTSITLGLLMLGLAVLAFRTRGVKKRGGFDSIIGQEGLILSVDKKNKNIGEIEIYGERWKCKANFDLILEERVRVTGREGFTLIINK